MRNQRMAPKFPKAFQLIGLNNRARAFQLGKGCTPYRESPFSSFPLLYEEDLRHQVKILPIFALLPLPVLGKQSIHRYRLISLARARQVRDGLAKPVFVYFFDLHNHCGH